MYACSINLTGILLSGSIGSLQEAFVLLEQVLYIDGHNPNCLKQPESLTIFKIVFFNVIPRVYS